MTKKQQTKITDLKTQIEQLEQQLKGKTGKTYHEYVKEQKQANKRDTALTADEFYTHKGITIATNIEHTGLGDVDELIISNQPKFPCLVTQLRVKVGKKGLLPRTFGSRVETFLNELGVLSFVSFKDNEGHYHSYKVIFRNKIPTFKYIMAKNNAKIIEVTQ